MSFVHPSFLWALGLLAIPIIIHLFNFRRYKKVEFSNVRMLKEIKSQSKRTRQLKKYLILLSRMLALAALVIAFAQPYLRGDESGQSDELVTLYIDNSQSMSAMGQDGQLLESAKQLARSFLKNMSGGQEVLILSNDFAQLKLRKAEEALSYIDDIDMSSKPNSLTDRLQNAKQWLSPSTNKLVCYAFSDFQIERDPQELDSSIRLYTIPLRAENTENISIDSVWLANPVNRLDKQIELYVQLSNRGTKTVKGVNLSLLINGANQSSSSFDIGPSQTILQELQFGSSSRGWLSGSVLINDPNFQYDNRYYFSLFLKEQLSVLQLGLEGKSFQSIFQDEYINLSATDPGNFDYASIDQYDLIILNELPSLSRGLQRQLREYLNLGGGVFFVPNSNFIGQDWSDLGVLSSSAELQPNLSLDPNGLQQAFYSSAYERLPKQIKMPLVKRTFRLQSKSSNVLLATKNGLAVLLEKPISKGKLYQLSFPLNPRWSDFTNHELLVISALRMLFSTGQTDHLAYELQSEEPVELRATDLEFPIELKGEGSQILLQGSSTGSQRFWLNASIDRAGHYGLYQGGTEESSAVISLNIARSESSMEFLSRSELVENLGLEIEEEFSSKASLLHWSRSTQSKPLWKLFILFCLIFLLLEILLLRFIKS